MTTQHITPCPFCGSPAELGADVETVTKAWNRREHVDDLAVLVHRLARALRRAAPDHDLPTCALGYLKRNGLQGSVWRE
jgi:hypothetical protein